MAQRSFPFDAGAGAAINETDWQNMARRLRQTGVIGGSLSQLAVSADGTALAVSVATGDAFVEGFFYRNDSALALTIAAANATNPRIDTVVVRLDRVANTATLAVVTGTAAASPVAPTLSQSDSLYELPLANVTVPAAAGVIAAADVTDRRKITQTFDSAAYLAKTQNLADLPDKAAARTNLGVVASAGQRIWISAPEMLATFGAPTLAGIGASGDKAAVAWLMDAASAENLSGQIYIPQGWATVDIALSWTNAGAGVGDVRWHLFRDPSLGAGSTLGGTLTAVSLTATAPAQNVLKLDLLATGVAVTELRLLGLRLQRDAGNATDSLANDAAVLGLEIRRAS